MTSRLNSVRGATGGVLSPGAEGRAASSQADAYLGGDDSVVRAPVRDVGLSSRWGLAVAHVHGPAVHTVFLPSTLRGGRAVRAGLGAGLDAGLCWALGRAGRPCKAGPPTPAHPLGPHGVSAQTPAQLFRGAVCAPTGTPSRSRGGLQSWWAVERPQRGSIQSQKVTAKP